MKYSRVQVNAEDAFRVREREKERNAVVMKMQNAGWSLVSERMR